MYYVQFVDFIDFDIADVAFEWISCNLWISIFRQWISYFRWWISIFRQLDIGTAC